MAPSSTRELIHLSYGSLPAQISTQYFDTQQAYFDYSPSAPRPLIDHDVSWLQGVEPGSGRDRYTPRWIVYDTRDGFRGLSTSDDAHDEEQEADDGAEVSGGSGAWSSRPQVMRVGQDDARTPFRALSSREARGDNFDWDAEMERHFADDDDGYEEEEEKKAGISAIRGGREDGVEQKAAPSTRRQRQRPWSHYLLFEPHPRSLVPIAASGNLPLDPMPLTEGGGDDDETGTELFETFESGHARSQGWEAEHDTFDTTFRSSLEACDRPQGFNVVLSASDAWSGFTGAQLELMADEYPKLAKVAWAARSGNADWHGGSGEDIDLKTLRRRRTRAMNEALSLLVLSQSLDLYVPLAAPQDSSSDRATASVLSSHFETATLGARLRDAPTSLSNLIDHLTWRGGTPLASLGGEVASSSSSSSAPPSSTAMDPIDALLASRGYGPASADAGRRRHPEQEAINARRTALREGADRIDAAWHCFSEARVDGTAPVTSSPAPSLWTSAKPFALSAVSRLGPTPAPSSSRAYGQPTSRTDIVQHWLHRDEEQRGEVASAAAAGPQLSEPWGRLLTTPLAQPSHAATPRRLRQQQPAAPLSALYCSAQPTLRHLSQARHTILGAVRGHAPLAAWGVGEGGAEGRVGGRDGLKDLLERVEELRGGYEDGGEGGDDDDDEDGGKGTDEEWEDQQGEDDDGLDWS